MRHNNGLWPQLAFFSPMLRPRRPLSYHVLLLPTSLVALPFLFYVLAYNGLLCHSNIPTFAPLPDPNPKASSLSVLSEEYPIPLPTLIQTSHLSPGSSDGHHHQTQPDVSLPSTDPERSERSELFPGFIRPNARSRRFSARVAEFFHGRRFDSLDSPCNPRFFMTWISSSELFRSRELLAVESLFKSHQNACLLIVSNAMDSASGKRLLRPFSKRGFRLAAISPDFNYLFENLPAQPWFDRLLQGEIDPGNVPFGQNLSNLIRLAILYKYGGVYIDTDVIVLRSFDGLRNAIGAQSVNAKNGNWSRLNNAVMVFDEEHPLLYKFMEEFVSTFNGSKWGHNGPYLVSRVAARLEGRTGFDFTVLPPEAFYPVNWRKIFGLFQAPRDRSHLKWIMRTHDSIRRRSFALHLWNKESSRIEIEKGSIIERIMSECCLFCNSSLSAM